MELEVRSDGMADGGHVTAGGGGSMKSGKRYLRLRMPKEGRAGTRQEAPKSSGSGRGSGRDKLDEGRGRSWGLYEHRLLARRVSH